MNRPKKIFFPDLLVELFTQFQVHEEVAEGTVDVAAVALNGRISGRVDQVERL
jgi:hypothetical protein